MEGKQKQSYGKLLKKYQIEDKFLTEKKELTLEQKIAVANGKLAVKYL